jgi:hypothetical protein
MTSADALFDSFRPEDRPLLEEARRIGENLCYVVAVATIDGAAFAAIDNALRPVVGYLGMTRLRSSDVDVFLATQEEMALVLSARIDGPRFTEISTAFHYRDELEAMGFTEIARAG